MDLFSWINPLYSLSGLGVGFIVGLTGVGGGSLMTPLLILLFGIHPSTAVGTDLLYAATTKSAGTLVHGLNGKVDWRIVGLLAAGSVPAATATALVLAYVGIESEGASHTISLILGIMLVLTSVTIAMRHRLQKFVLRHREVPLRGQAILTVVFGAIVGVLVTISSVGAGAVGVTVLMLLYPRMPVLKIVATDIAHAVPLTLVAGIAHWAIGSIDWSMLGSLLIGSIPGIVVASFLAPKVNPRFLRYGLAFILAIVGLRLLTA